MGRHKLYQRLYLYFLASKRSASASVLSGPFSPLTERMRKRRAFADKSLETLPYHNKISIGTNAYDSRESIQHYPTFLPPFSRLHDDHLLASYGSETKEEPENPNMLLMACGAAHFDDRLNTHSPYSQFRNIIGNTSDPWSQDSRHTKEFNKGNDRGYYKEEKCFMERFHSRPLTDEQLQNHPSLSPNKQRKTPSEISKEEQEGYKNNITVQNTSHDLPWLSRKRKQKPRMEPNTLAASNFQDDSSGFSSQIWRGYCPPRIPDRQTQLDSLSGLFPAQSSACIERAFEQCENSIGLTAAYLARVRFYEYQKHLKQFQMMHTNNTFTLDGGPTASCYPSKINSYLPRNMENRELINSPFTPFLGRLFPIEQIRQNQYLQWLQKYYESLRVDDGDDFMLKDKFQLFGNSSTVGSDLYDRLRTAFLSSQKQSLNSAHDSGRLHSEDLSFSATKQQQHIVWKEDSGRGSSPGSDGPLTSPDDSNILDHKLQLKTSKKRHGHKTKFQATRIPEDIINDDEKYGNRKSSVRGTSLAADENLSPLSKRTSSNGNRFVTKSTDFTVDSIMRQ